MSIYIIVNPQAAGGKSLQRWRSIQKALGQHKIEFTAVFTQKPGDASEHAARAVVDGYRRIAACGGDGTLHEVVNGALQSYNDFSQIEFAFIPTGTSCDFAKGLPMKTPIDILRSDKTASFDIIEVSLLGKNRKPKRELCINSCNIGIIANAARAINERESFIGKLFGADAAYAAAGIYSIVKASPVKCKLASNNSWEELLSYTVSKSGWIAGGMKLGVEPGRRDGKMSVVTMGKRSILGILGVIPRLYTGKAYKDKNINFSQSAWASIITETPHIVEGDGEILGFTPASFKICEQRINVVI